MTRPFRLIGLAALVASASAALGFGLWRLEIDGLERRVDGLERRNAALERVIEACDKYGVGVILGCFYQRQDQILADEAAVRQLQQAGFLLTKLQ